MFTKFLFIIKILPTDSIIISISRVVFEGYVDDDEIMMCDNIFNAMEKTEIERADVRKLKRSMVN